MSRRSKGEGGYGSNHRVAGQTRSSWLENIDQIARAVWEAHPKPRYPDLGQDDFVWFASVTDGRLISPIEARHLFNWLKWQGGRPELELEVSWEDLRLVIKRPSFLHLPFPAQFDSIMRQRLTTGDRRKLAFLVALQRYHVRVAGKGGRG